LTQKITISYNSFIMNGASINPQDMKAQ